MRIIPDSQLIINDEGNVFHLHVKLEQLTDKVIMMGAPIHVSISSKKFYKIEYEVQSREFHNITDYYNCKRRTACSIAELWC